MPSKINEQKIRRVVDANYNRAKEGLRVCEDVCRFVWDDKNATSAFKRVRHDLTKAILVFGLKDIVVARDIVADVGKQTIAAESCRLTMADIFYANAQRVKESLRVLEEFAKLHDVKVAGKIKKIRYSVYDIEKQSLARM